MTPDTRVGVPGRPRRQPTIRDVADHAGVSPMTVSRTLADVPTVGEELRQKVLNSARVLGYHRNENARSLRPGHSPGLIGVAITNVANPYYGAFIKGIEEVASPHGKRILLGDTSESPALEQQLTNDFLGRQVDGLIVVPTGSTGLHLARACSVGTPVVVAARQVPGVPLDSVILDDEGSSYAATTELFAQGHRAVAFLGNTHGVLTSAQRFRGFARAFEDYGTELNPLYETAGQQDVEAASAAMAWLLDLPEPPTAVFSANNRNSVGAVREIVRRISAGSLRVEDAPALTSFDDFELSDALPIPITVIESDPAEMGRAAGRLLMRRMAEGPVQFVPETIVLPTRVSRRSL